MQSIKPVDEMTLAETAALNAQLAAIRAQVLADHASGAKRDEEALKIEREWYRQNRHKK